MTKESKSPAALLTKLPSTACYPRQPKRLKMSDKVREFVEIPQHFLKEGNQVSCPPPAKCRNVAEYLLALLSSSPAAQSLHRRVCDHKILLQLQSPWVAVLTSPCAGRIPPNLKGSRNWLRRYGFHRLFCQADTYPYVSASLVPEKLSS